MLIKSQAGDFEISVSSFEREGDDLVIVGAMGVWQARTHTAPKELVSLLRKILGSWVVWAYVLKLPFLLLKGSGASHADQASDFEQRFR